MERSFWPAERMQSITTGWLGGGLLDAAIHSGTDAKNKTLLASALDSPSQLDALQELDLRTLLALSPGTTIVRHFGNDQKIDAEYKAWGGNGLSLFPPKEGEDAIAALDELVTVYKANFEEFARNARTRLAAKKR